MSQDSSVKWAWSWHFSCRSLRGFSEIVHVGPAVRAVCFLMWAALIIKGELLSRKNPQRIFPTQFTPHPPPGPFPTITQSSEWFTPEPWPHYSWPQYKTVGLHWPWVVGGQGELGTPERAPDIRTVAKKSHSRLDAEGVCKSFSSEELSHFLLPPLASHWLSTIFIDLLLPGNLVCLSLPSLSLPARSKKKTLFSGGAILLSQPFWMSKEYSYQIEGKKRTTRWNLNFR